MTERELVGLAKKNNEAALSTLWFQYENLVHKQWHVLRKQMNNSSIVREYKDDFYSDSYIAFRKAIDAIDLKKIRDDNWKLIGYFRWYLQTLRNNTIKNLLQTYHHEESLYAVNADGDEVLRSDVAGLEYEDVPARIDMEASLEKVGRNWSAKKKYVVKRRMEGAQKKEIAQELNNHPAMVTFILKGVRKDFEQHL